MGCATGVQRFSAMHSRRCAPFVFLRAIWCATSCSAQMPPHVGNVGDDSVQGDFSIPNMATEALCHARVCCLAGSDPNGLDGASTTEEHAVEMCGNCPGSDCSPRAACDVYCNLQHAIAETVADFAGPTVMAADITLLDVECPGVDQTSLVDDCDVAIIVPHPPPLFPLSGAATADVVAVAGSITVDVSDDMHSMMTIYLCDPESVEFLAFERSVKEGIAADMPGVSWENVTLDRSSLIPTDCPGMGSVHGEMHHDMSITIPQQLCHELEYCGSEECGGSLTLGTTDCADLDEAGCRSLQENTISRLKQQAANAMSVDVSTVHFSSSNCGEDFRVTHSDGNAIMGTPAGTENERTGQLSLNLTEDLASRICDPDSVEAAAFKQNMQQLIAARMSTPDSPIDPSLVHVDISAFMHCPTSHESDNNPLDADFKFTHTNDREDDGSSVLFDGAIIAALFICVAFVARKRFCRRNQVSYARMGKESYGMVGESTDEEDSTIGEAGSEGYNSDADRINYDNPVEGSNSNFGRPLGAMNDAWRNRGATRPGEAKTR